MPTHDERCHHHEWPCEDGDDDHDPVISMDFCNTLNELLKKCQERKFDGEDGGPDQSHEGVKIWSHLKQLLDSARMEFQEKGGIS